MNLWFCEFKDANLKLTRSKGGRIPWFQNRKGSSTLQSSCCQPWRSAVTQLMSTYGGKRLLFLCNEKHCDRSWTALLVCRPHRCISSCQSYSTFSSENFSVSDGEEGNTSDHSNSPDEQAAKLEDELAEKLEDMLSQTPEIPIEISTQSDGLSDKECAVRRVKTQMSLGKLCTDEHSCEVSCEFIGPLFNSLGN